MKITLQHNSSIYQANLTQAIDISISLEVDQVGPNCFWAPPFSASPVISGDWIGDTTNGGDVNFKNVNINPHGNGTHTECVGHIAKEKVTINEVLTDYHHIAQLITIFPTRLDNGDRVITKTQIEEFLEGQIPPALIIRTLPNTDDKIRRVYSGTNPPYVEAEALTLIREAGITHLLLDLPSVDREQDDGKLAGHKAFWDYPATIDKKKTITEMVFVNNNVSDGLYLLNLQIASFEIDASPSKPVLYELEEI